ncbi:hypothetical protein B0H10DRAFT_2233653 [Mycena sp. CBHHK59/15]|nr:hypothetical protein B0H10DRAFT_2233653 [Mycena sp. CBHHK59/15]
MGKGKFNEAQNQHIQSYFPEFVQELDKGLSGTPLTHWKQTKASKIIETPAFATLDLESLSRKAWFEGHDCSKFTNYRNQVYLKSAEGSTSTLSVKKGNPLLKFASIPTGRQLFAQESHDSKKRALSTGEKNPAALYQQILKDRWDALSVEDQSSWNDRAETDAADVAKNQAAFAANISLALNDLCQGRILGAAEMVLFYGFRDPEDGDLLAGSVQGAAVSNPIIPRNPSNQPVLPAIDLNTVSIAEVRVLLVHPVSLSAGEGGDTNPSTPPVQPVSPLRTSAAPEKTPVPDDTPPTPVAPPLGSGPSTPPLRRQIPAENSKGKEEGGSPR